MWVFFSSLKARLPVGIVSFTFFGKGLDFLLMVASKDEIMLTWVAKVECLDVPKSIQLAVNNYHFHDRLAFCIFS